MEFDYRRGAAEVCASDLLTTRASVFCTLRSVLSTYSIISENEYICIAQFKQSSYAPLLHYRAGVESFQLPRECLDGRRQSSSVGRLFQMTTADTANALVPMTVLVRCTDSFFYEQSSAPERLQYMLPSSGTDEMKAVCAALHVAEGRSPSTNPQGHIEFSGVRFSYPSRPEVNVFSGLDLVVPSGSVTAVVGSSGSGHRHLILYSV